MKKFPATRGLAWFAGGIALIRAQPARLLLIGLVLQFLLGFTQLGALGLVLVLAVPALTAGVMQSFALVEQGLRPPLMTLFSAFSDPQKTMRLFILSLVMIAAGLMTASFFMSGVAASLDAEFLSRLEQGDVDAVLTADPEVIQQLAIALLAAFLVSGSLSYFAIPLVWFHKISVGSAILEGLVGMLKNWLPFLVLGVLMMIVAMPVAILSVTLLANSMAAGSSSTILTLLMLLMMVGFQLLIFGAQFMSFRDIFGTGTTDSATDSGDDQLVA